MSLKMQRTFRVGDSASFLWQSSEAIDSQVVNPVTLAVADVAYSSPMTQLIADINIVSGGISTDRTVLTASLAPSVISNITKYGEAFLVTDEGESFAVKVISINGTAITLSAPLSDEITLSGLNPYLQFALWTAPLTNADVTATANYRGLEWSVTYTKVLSGDGAGASKDIGLLKVVRVPFETGLNHHKLVGWFSELEVVEHGQSDWSPQIEMAYIELAQRIEADVSEMIATAADDGTRIIIDDVQSQHSALQQVHAHLTASLIAATDGNFENAEYHLTRAFGPESTVDLRRSTGLYELAMRPIWIDANRDGTVIDSEVKAVTAPGPGITSTGFSSTARVGVTRVR